jgi:transposase
VVKRVLFMAAMAAVRHHQDLRSFHQRLRAAGKKPIVALVAVMRKLVVLCNARLATPRYDRLPVSWFDQRACFSVCGRPPGCKARA